ncbi:DUF4244 domain-containing protein [Actinopolyspora mortivallis]|uniref:DUF4244 domain-containing protein n=1 Tax=Actinopolyspora mortivallis TaxID=33906 RepID=A0A2T0GWC8_ACTMO|nr:DUF4244 domain-containing protein [Actinopolyspora mortivallis]PRW63409.1 DUF4244 domain-containing protein [Actinopolyspora mortivallis]
MVVSGTLPHRGARKLLRRLGRGVRRPLSGEEGMSTAEYAIGTLAAAAFAALLYTVVTSDAVTEALSSLVRRALSEPSFGGGS